MQAVLAGNAVAVHDMEAAIFGTTLGMDGAGRPTQGGHGTHMRAINAVRAAGSIASSRQRACSSSAARPSSRQASCSIRELSRSCCTSRASRAIFATRRL